MGIAKEIESGRSEGRCEFGTVRFFALKVDDREINGFNDEIELFYWKSGSGKPYP